MNKSGFITPSGPIDDPLGHFRTALLTVAMALAVVLCLLLLTVPRTTHAIKIDAWDPQYLPPSMLSYGPQRVLRIGANGRLTYGGAAVADLRQLRLLVDLDQQRVPVPTLCVEPDARLRYGDFIEVLAVIKRARVYDFSIDFDPERQRVTTFKCPRRPSGID